MSPLESWLIVLGAWVVALIACAVLSALVGSVIKILQHEGEPPPRIYRGSARLR